MLPTEAEKMHNREITILYKEKDGDRYEIRKAYGFNDTRPEAVMDFIKIYRGRVEEVSPDMEIKLLERGFRFQRASGRQSRAARENLRTALHK